MTASTQPSLAWPAREYYSEYRAAVMDRMARALGSSPATNGVQVAELEGEIARRTGARHCVAVASATAGLTLALRHVLQGRTGPVAAPVLSFNATVLAPVWNGRRVCCLPADTGHLNLCAGALRHAVAARPIAAITAIGVGGNPSSLAELGRVARESGVPFILDAAPCLGAQISAGALSAIADAAVISLSSRKVLPAGEGGLVLTDRDDLASALRRARVYGSTNGFFCVEPGWNARMSELHAAAALGALPGLDPVLRRRSDWALALRRTLSEIPGVRLQAIDPAVTPAWNDVIAAVPPAARDAIVLLLQDLGIPAVPFYSPLIHRHPAFAPSCDPDLGDRASEMDDLAASLVAIPVLSTLAGDEAAAVAGVFARMLRS